MSQEPFQSLVNNSQEIQSMILEHFQNIYQSSNPSFPSDLENLFPSKISELDNELLCSIPLEEEILSTIKQISSSKFPGPDDFTGFFYKHY